MFLKCKTVYCLIFVNNKDEKAHRFALSGDIWREKERERERKRGRERNSFGILYTGYLLSIVKIKREIEINRNRQSVCVCVRERGESNK